MNTNGSTTSDTAPKTPKSESDSIPWVLIVFGWLIVLGAMTSAVVIAVKNSPQSIPLDPPASASHGR